MRTLLLVAFLFLLGENTARVAAQPTPPARTTPPTALPDSVARPSASPSHLAPGGLVEEVGQALQLQTFEDTYVGHVNDSDDEGFMEFKLSVYHQFDFFNDIVNRLRRNKLAEATHYVNLNFAFTGRFAQYIATRTSSPVVGKRFNPYIFLGYDFQKSPVQSVSAWVWA